MCIHVVFHVGRRCHLLMIVSLFILTGIIERHVICDMYTHRHWAEGQYLKYPTILNKPI